MLNSARILSEDDRCRRAAFYFQRWKLPSLTPKEILRQSIEFGLECVSDNPGDAASDEAMRLATEVGLDTAETDLLGLATHVASLAEFIVWLLRTGDAWSRPESIKVGNHAWEPSTFLSATESHLRRIALCSRWDAATLVEQEHNWYTLEGAIYTCPVDIVVIVVGQFRSGRWHSPLTRGWTHPVSKQLRFRKRDGTGFDGAWEPVFREQSDFTREEWLDALVEDGLLPECVLIHQVENIGRGIDVHGLAQAKLSRIQTTRTPPDPQLSRCFDRFHPCPFRSCCPRGLEPSEDLGFVPRSHHPANFTAQIIG